MPSNAPRFQVWIPDHMRALFGGKRERSKLLTGVAANRKKEAIRRERAKHDELLATLEHATEEQKAEIIAAGGWDAYQANAVAQYAKLKGHAALAPSTSQLAAPGNIFVRSGRDIDVSASLAAVSALPANASRDECLSALVAVAPPRLAAGAERFGMVQHVEKLHTDVAELAPIALQAAPASDFNLDALFALWVRVKKPKGTRKHKATLGLFKSCLAKDVDFRHVTTEDVQRFADHLIASGQSPIGTVKHLDNLRGLYSASIPRHRKDNPGRNVKPEVKVVEGIAEAPLEDQPVCPELVGRLSAARSRRGSR